MGRPVRDSRWFAILNRACGVFLWGPGYAGAFKTMSSIVPLVEVMADYARWGMENGVAVEFVLDAKGYDIHRSAEAFDPPEVRGPFSISEGYQHKYRMSADGELVVGYLRNVAEVSKFTVETWWNNSRPWAHFRVRKPLTAEVRWQLPADEYALTVWDLDTGEKAELPNAGKNGAWKQEAAEHDFLLVWRG